MRQENYSFYEFDKAVSKLLEDEEKTIATIKKSDYSEVTGEVIGVSTQNISIDLSNGINGTETITWVTVRDKDGKEHKGTLIN